MNPAVNLENIADALGLNHKAADIYVSILAHGELTRDELHLLLDIPVSEIVISLTQLLAKGLICQTPEGGEDAFRSEDLANLPVHLRQKLPLMQELETFLPPTLRLARKLGIVKYEGLTGVRKVYLEVLEEAKKCGEPILAFERGLDAASLGTTFIRKYIQRRIDAGIQAYVLSPATSEDRAYQEQFEGKLTHVKLLPEFDIRANINVVGDLVMSFDLEPAQGTLRRDNAEAQTMKCLFRELWKRSP